MESLKVTEYSDPYEFLNDITIKNRFNKEYSCDWIYRGHSDSSYPLLPTIVRNFKIEEIDGYLKNIVLKDGPNLLENRVDTVFDAFPERHKINKQYLRRLNDIILLNILESYMVQQFLFESNKAVLDVPSLNAGDFNFWYLTSNIDFYIKKYLMVDESSKLVDLVTNKPINESMKFTLHEQDTERTFGGNFFNYFNLLNITEHSLSRHHGVPARLLDWTSDPLVASLFATIGHDRQQKKDICVWRLNKRNIYNFLQVHDKIIQKGLKFLTLQKGLFIEISHFDDYYLFEGEWPTLEKYILYYLNSFDGILEKIILKAERVDDLKKLLNTMEYKKHIYMPIYDNVGQYIKPVFMK